MKRKKLPARKFHMVEVLRTSGGKATPIFFRDKQTALAWTRGIEREIERTRQAHGLRQRPSEYTYRYAGTGTPHPYARLGKEHDSLQITRWRKAHNRKFMKDLGPAYSLRARKKTKTRRRR